MSSICYHNGMHLLLTSAGFTNPTIINALKELTDAKFGKPFGELSLVFVTTAANVGNKDDKGWLVDDLKRTYDLGFDCMDIMDFVGLPLDLWESRIREADIIMFGGGNTFHLMHSIRSTPMERVLKELIEEKVYVGISAGSMVTSHNIGLSSSARLYSEAVGPVTDDTGLGWFPYHFRPHLNSEWFTNVRIPLLEEQAKRLGEPIYALDDQCALKVVDGDIRPVGDGVWKLIEP
jgi:dipeptidase E